MYHITITGSIGSGKSVVAKQLKELLGIELESIGSIQRRMAQQYGMTTIEFNKYMESHNEIDSELDKFVENEGKKSKLKIFDSRLAWHFVPNSLKVFLFVSEKIAAERIYNDHQRISEYYNSIEETLCNIQRRRESEYLRYKNQYNINLDDLSNYDVILDTGYTTVEENALFIKNIFEKKDKKLHKLWLSPNTLKPTENIREYGRLYRNNIELKFKVLDDYLECPIKVLFFNHNFYIFDGHKRVINALIKGINLVPCILLNTSDGFRLFKTEEVGMYIKDHNKTTINTDWEDLCEIIKKRI